MAIVEKYRSRNAGRPGERFVRRCHPDGYFWCIRDLGDTRLDLAQGTCDAADLPDDVRARADEMKGRAFSYVEWP